MTELEKNRVQSYLNSYRDYIELWEAVCARHEALTAKAYSAGSPIIDGMPRGSDPADRTARFALQLEELEKQAAELYERAYQICNEIVQMVDAHIANPLQKSVIMAKYIDLANWGEINDIMFGSCEDYDEKEEAYMLRIFRAHKAALEILLLFVPQSSDEEEKNT